MRPNVLTPLSVGLLLAVPSAWGGVAAETSTPQLREQATFEGQAWWNTTLVFSPDGKILAATGDGTIRLVGVARGKIITTLRRAGFAPAFSPDGKTLATCADWKIHLWDVASRKNIATIRNDVIVHWVVFSPDGKILTAVGKEWLSVWSLEKKEELRSFKLPSRPALVTTYSAIKRPVVAVTHGSGRASFTLVDPFTGDSALACDGHRGPLQFFAMDRAESRVASVGVDETVRLWDRTSGENIATIKFGPATAWCLALSPDGKILALGYDEDHRVSGKFGGGFRLYNVPSSELLATEEVSGIRCLAFSPDSRVLASSAGGTITLWTIPAAWRKPDKGGHAPAPKKKDAR